MSTWPKYSLTSYTAKQRGEQMAFYHATNLLIYRIDLSLGRNRVDFGKGFYLTDKFGTARDWAIRKVELEGEGTPTVLSYEIDSGLYTLPGMRFAAIPGIEWLEFICSNRRFDSSGSNKKEPRHDHHWVAGPIADDKVVDVVAEYMRDEIAANKAIERLKALPQTYQLSLHTSEALAFVDEGKVFYKQYRNGRWSQNWMARVS